MSALCLRLLWHESMTKLLLLLVLALVAYLVLRSRSGVGRRPPADTKRPGSENIVACSRCGIHIPASESVEANGRHYCSEEHRRLG